MSIETFSKFYFGHTVAQTNSSIDFNEGAGELQAIMNVGDYTLEEYMEEIKRAMDAVGALTYTVSVARASRIVTISSTANFTLLAGTGTRVGTGAWGMMGFAAVDVTGAAIYNSVLASGEVYLPQHLLESYIEPENFIEKTDAVVNESASGKVQVILFGTTQYIQMEIKFATNRVIRSVQTQIEQNLTGVASLRALMDYLVTKAKIEFMPDRDNANSFYKVILEKSQQHKSGTAYTLIEKDKQQGYYETGVLTFRVVI